MSDLQIDPRGYRFGAAVTLVVSATALVLEPSSTAALIVMGVLVALFVPGALIGPQATVQAWLFKQTVRRRLDPPTETESFRPPRFAQQMGLAMSVAALGLGIAGVELGFTIFAALIVAASFLNAVLGFCLGCEIYLLLQRLTRRSPEVSTP